MSYFISWKFSHFHEQQLTHIYVNFVLIIYRVMYLCVRGIVTKPVPCQEDERSYICLSEVLLPSLYHARKTRGHVFVLEVLLPSLYHARKMRGHIFVCQRYCYQVCTMPGRREVMYLY